MKARHATSTKVRPIQADASVGNAARIMLEEDLAWLAVARNERRVGAITDRDIVLRVVAEGRDPETTEVGEVMTPSAWSQP